MPAADNPNLPPPPEVREEDFLRPSVADTLKRQHAETASKLAAWLIAILAGGIVLNYLCVLILVWLKRDDALKAVEDSFHQWLPIVSSLAGGAVTYYFTKEGR